MTDPGALALAEFGFPGPLRDKLVEAILSGAKTSTTGTLLEYEIENEALPAPGIRSVVIDSAGAPVAIIETTALSIARLADVDLAHAIDEGEGYTSVAEWRVAHVQFWESKQMREYLGDPGFVVDDDTALVLERFRLIEIL